MVKDEEFSVLRGEGSYFRMILSREPSVGSSSSNGLMYSNTVTIPFDWEMQPGKPRTPPRDAESVPPISPPPLFGAGLVPRPKTPELPEGSGWSRLKLRRMVKKHRNSSKIQGWTSMDGLQCLGFLHRVNHGNSITDSGSGSLTPSSNSSSSSSGSSSASSSSRYSRQTSPQASKLHALAKDLVKWPF